MLVPTLLLSGGCAKGQIKVSETELQVQKIRATLSDLERTLMEKDWEGFQKLFLREFLRENPALFEAVARTFQEGRSTQLSLQVDLIQIDGSRATVYLHWEATAVPVGRTGPSRGNTTLHLAQDQQSMKIMAIEGDNPLATGAPAPGS